MLAMIVGKKEVYINVQSKNLTKIYIQDDYITKVKFLSNTYLAIASTKFIWIYNYHSKKLMKKFATRETIYDMVITSNSNIVTVSDLGSTKIHIYDPVKGWIREIDKCCSYIVKLGVLKNGNIVGASTFFNDSVRIYNLDTGLKIEISINKPIGSFAVLPNGNLVVATSCFIKCQTSCIKNHNNIFIYNENGELLKTFLSLQQYSSSITVLANGNFLIAGEFEDSYLEVYNPEKGFEVRHYVGSNKFIASLPNGDLAIAHPKDHIIYCKYTNHISYYRSTTAGIRFYTPKKDESKQELNISYNQKKR